MSKEIKPGSKVIVLTDDSDEHLRNISPDRGFFAGDTFTVAAIVQQKSGVFVRDGSGNGLNINRVKLAEE